MMHLSGTDLPSTALVLVDLQHDYLEGSSSGRVGAAARGWVPQCRARRMPGLHGWPPGARAGET
ncbi:MAG: hypothetical protein ACKOUR_04370, partial [Planctomycetota bacterium]